MRNDPKGNPAPGGMHAEKAEGTIPIRGDGYRSRAKHALGMKGPLSALPDPEA